MTTRDTAHRSGPRRTTLLAPLLVLLALALGGCGAEHMGPGVGRALERVQTLQAQPDETRKGGKPQALAAEDAELVLANLRQQSRTPVNQSSTPGIQLMALQR